VKTVTAYVDPHARRLVAAINTSALMARTVSCCSGHYHKPGLPYVAFRCLGWDFVRFLLPVVSGLNRATRAQTSISLRELRDEREISGSLKLALYPWLLPGIDCTPLLADVAKPPRSLVRLWWRELDELAAMIEERRTWPSREFVAFLDEQWGGATTGGAAQFRPGLGWPSNPWPRSGGRPTSEAVEKV